MGLGTTTAGDSPITERIQNTGRQTTERLGAVVGHLIARHVPEHSYFHNASIPLEIPEPDLQELGWIDALDLELENRHNNSEPTDSSVAIPAPGVCISLGLIIMEIETIARTFTVEDIPGQLMMAAVLNHLFYGSYHRGNKYYSAIAALELVDIPLSDAEHIYQYAYQRVRHELQLHFGDNPCYIEYAYQFINTTDIIIIPVPLHHVHRINRGHTP